jgi:hypothetical protein
MLSFGSLAVLLSMITMVFLVIRGSATAVRA